MANRIKMQKRQKKQWISGKGKSRSNSIDKKTKKKGTNKILSICGARTPLTNKVQGISFHVYRKFIKNEKHR